MIDRAFVRIEAKAGKEDAVESFLTDALAAVREEDKTIDWFAVKFGKRVFAIFDTFPDGSGRLAHLAGTVGRALIAKKPTLIEGLPKIEHAEVLTSK